MTTTFCDRFNKEWNLEIDLAAAWKIEEYNFQNQTAKVQMIPASEDLFTHRITDAKVCFGMAWVLLQDQIRAFNEDPESWTPKNLTPINQIKATAKIQTEYDFAVRLDGKAILELKLALWEALINFFPEHRTILTTLTERFSRVLEKIDQRLSGEASRRLSDQEIDNEINKALEAAEKNIDQKREEFLAPLRSASLPTG